MGAVSSRQPAKSHPMMKPGGHAAQSVEAGQEDLLAVLNGIVEMELARVGRGIMKKVAKCLQSRARAVEETSAQLARIIQSLEAVTRGQAELLVNGQAPAAVSENEAVRVFALMKSLDDGDRKRKAPLGRVFHLLVLEGLSQGAVAVKCGCSPGLVSLRATAIRRIMKRPVAELRALASRLGEMESSVEDSRARKIHRRGLTDDTGMEDDDG